MTNLLSLFFYCYYSIIIYDYFLSNENNPGLTINLITVDYNFLKHTYLYSNNIFDLVLYDYFSTYNLHFHRAIYKCQWRESPRPDLFTVNYSTCTPDINTCPNGNCDQLEKENSLICPQDCTGIDK